MEAINDDTIRLQVKSKLKAVELASLLAQIRITYIACVKVKELKNPQVLESLKQADNKDKIKDIVASDLRMFDYKNELTIDKVNINSPGIIEIMNFGGVSAVSFVTFFKMYFSVVSKKVELDNKKLENRLNAFQLFRDEINFLESKGFPKEKIDMILEEYALNKFESLSNLYKLGFVLEPKLNIQQATGQNKDIDKKKGKGHGLSR